MRMCYCHETHYTFAKVINQGMILAPCLEGDMKKHHSLELLLVALVSIMFYASPAYAYDYEYYESNNDEYSHTRYYGYYDSSEYSDTESCSWELSYCEPIEYGESGHICHYVCEQCYAEKEVYKDCSWRLGSKFFGLEFFKAQGRKELHLQEMQQLKAGNEESKACLQVD